ncbi:MAG: DUF4974 domain-containing protein [Alphaproteobacteria bacterium]|nr:DUF4974 domain-containing protein [Alphaproteobacteria bacterium]
MQKKKQLVDFLEDPCFREMVLDQKHQSFWEEWIRQNPDQKVTFDLAVNVLKNIDENEDTWELARKNALLKKINTSRIRQSQEEKGAWVNLRGVLFAIAVCVGGFLWWYAERSGTRNEVVPDQQLVAEAWVIKSNPIGQKSRFTLPDGTSVTLNAASEIKYSTDFAKKNREVHLKGEAFFDVAEDSMLVFEVHAGSLITRALGTSFNITNYSERHPRIQLMSGSVVVAQEDNPSLEAVRLVPGQEAILTPQRSLRTQDFDISKATLWKDGILYFHSASFPEVILTLERWYGVTIAVENVPQQSPNVTAEFKKDYLENVLHSLSFTFDFDYSIDNKEVVIKFNAEPMNKKE